MLNIFLLAPRNNKNCSVRDELHDEQHGGRELGEHRQEEPHRLNGRTCQGGGSPSWVLCIDSVVDPIQLALTYHPIADPDHDFYLMRIRILFDADPDPFHPGRIRIRFRILAFKKGWNPWSFSTVCLKESIVTPYTYLG